MNKMDMRRGQECCYLQEAFKQSGFKQLKTLSSGSVMMVANEQNGHETRSGMLLPTVSLQTIRI